MKKTFIQKAINNGASLLFNARSKKSFLTKALQQKF